MKRTLDVVSLNRRAWENIAERYNRRQPSEVSKIFDFFCDKIPAGGRVLDLGSGTGLPYAKLLVERGFNVKGVDISPTMVRIAQKNVPEAEFIELSMTDIDFKDEFDGVLSIFSMLLLDPAHFRGVSSSIVRSLTFGGVLYLVLNEPPSEDCDPDQEAIVEIMGETMYSRAYTQREVQESFIPKGMKLLRFNRKIQVSKEFGEEHVIEFLFKKISPKLNLGS